MNKLTVVVGAQFGSEGKGSIAGWLAAQHAGEYGATVVLRVGGPNAGHTVYGVGCSEPCDECDPVYGHPWRLRQVPVGAVTNLQARLMIGPGSEVDPKVLNDELYELDFAGYNASNRLLIDESATILSQDHIDEEKHRKLSDRIGSTAKGIGAARIDRLWRSAQTVGDYELGGLIVGKTADELNRLEAISLGTHLIIEGTQGYGLGLHTDYYPQVTSGDCRAIDFLAQAGVSPWSSMWDKFEVVLVARTFPIRVAGNSGPLRGETDWDTLGLPEEKTTVTKKTRRVGSWDPDVVRQAVLANGGGSDQDAPVSLALTMVDHMLPGVKDKGSLAEIKPEDRARLTEMLHSVEVTCNVDISMIGTGPNSIIEFEQEEN